MKEFLIGVPNCKGMKNYSDADIIAAVTSSISHSGVLRKLGLVPAGGNYATIKQKVRDLGLDTGHFKGQGHLRGMSNPWVKKRPLDEVLVEIEVGQPAFKTNHLKNRLIREGKLEPTCSSCGLTTWLTKPIPLELDHINGKNRDNRIENLRLLCPNCHALTPTYRARNCGKLA